MGNIGRFLCFHFLWFCPVSLTFRSQLKTLSAVLALAVGNRKKCRTLLIATNKKSQWAHVLSYRLIDNLFNCLGSNEYQNNRLKYEGRKTFWSKIIR